MISESQRSALEPYLTAALGLRRRAPACPVGLCRGPSGSARLKYTWPSVSHATVMPLGPGVSPVVEMGHALISQRSMSWSENERPRSRDGPAWVITLSGKFGAPV